MAYQSIQTLLRRPRNDTPHLYVVSHNAQAVGVLFLRPKSAKIKLLHEEGCVEMETSYQDPDSLESVLQSLLARFAKRFKYDTQALVFAGPMSLS